MQQLDLFGFPIETPAPKKKEKAATAKAVTVIAPAEPKHEEKEATPVAAVTPAPVTPVQETTPPVAEVKQETQPISLEAIRAQLAEENKEPVAVEPIQPAVEETPAPIATITPAPTVEETVEPVAATIPVIAVEEDPVAIPETTAPTMVVEPKPGIVATAAVEKKAAPAKDKTATSKAAAPVKQAGKRGRKSFKEMDSEADLVEVPDDETLQKKLYYSISEVAGWFKVNTSLLRYWENEFDVLQPRKTRKGDRLFRVEDVKNLQLIYFLLRQRKFSIDGAKKLSQEQQAGSRHPDQTRRIAYQIPLVPA